MFPTGGPGVGLLLLRVAVTIALATNDPSWFAWLVIACITLGLATPILAVVAVLLHISTVEMATASSTAMMTAPLTAAALALLGPGAYSIDALRYGRRLVVAPEEHD